MSQSSTLLLGFIAGVTIMIGLPIGRLRAPRPALRQFLSAVAIGVLLFLFWDVLSNGWIPVDGALADLREHGGGIGPVVGYASLYFAGLATGLMTLAWYERWLHGRGRSEGSGPGTSAGGRVVTPPAGIAGWSAARRLSLLIACGIGLHNFGEGLAIGASAATGAVTLATVLVIGFGLHNATEGFGIVAPLAAGGERPSWGFLLGMGLIGGGPTFVGTVVGRQFNSPALSVMFLTLAAGSILYVLVQLVGVATRHRAREALYAGVLVGLVAGFVTDMVVTAGGG